jgi:hypothetical protein
MLATYGFGGIFRMLSVLISLHLQMLGLSQAAIEQHILSAPESPLQGTDLLQSHTLELLRIAAVPAISQLRVRAGPSCIIGHSSLGGV